MMTDNTKTPEISQNLPLVEFIEGNGPGYVRIYFPDEGSRREFLVKSVPDGIRDAVASETFQHMEELPLGEHGTYDAWVYDRNPKGLHVRENRLPTVDVRDAHAQGSPDRIENFRSFIFDHLGIESPDK